MKPSFSLAVLSTAFTSVLYTSPVFAQTYTKCNPLTNNNCPADPALGKTIDVDFTSGASKQFTPTGQVNYGQNGAEFTVAKQGDSPLITSDFYIMFGHVDYVIQTAPGQGIVSSAVFQSDDLDEIDWEWLGGNDNQAQSNYFGKGETTEYNRGAFHNNPGNHDGFHTYSVDWTADALTWSLDGNVVRTLTPQTADANQYPQTPMVIKVGVWAGGDPSNPQGTISWAGGLTNYADGPYTMYLKSIHVADYSTGTEYEYTGNSGTWQSIKAVNGQVNSSGGQNSSSSTSGSGVTSSVTASTQPTPFATSESSNTATNTRTGYPWVASSSTLNTAASTGTAAATSAESSASFSSASPSSATFTPSSSPSGNLGQTTLVPMATIVSLLAVTFAFWML